MLISVVFSFRNEEEVLEELIQRTVAALVGAGLEYELIFVDDASLDRSPEILAAHAGGDERIKVITMSRVFGVSPCRMAGLRFARGDAVVFLDTDLQDPPELIPRMVEIFRNGADVVHTVRTERLGENPLKMWLTRQAYRLINSVSEIHLPENAGDFKLLGRQVVDRLAQLHEFEPYLRGLVNWIGFRQEYLEYRRDPRFAGTPKFPLLSSLGPFKEFVRGITAFSDVPLYLALWLGFLVSVGAFLGLIFVIVTKLIGWHLPGWPALMVTMLFLGGVILFTNGVIGLYVGRIFRNVQGRPPYIIHHTTNIGGAERDPAAPSAPDSPP